MKDWREERRELGLEIIARNRFEKDFSDVSEALVQDRPKDEREILRRWTEVLRAQRRFLHVSAFQNIDDQWGCDVKPLEDAQWPSLANREEFQNAVLTRSSLRAPIRQSPPFPAIAGQLLVAPCPGAAPPISFAAIVAGERAYLEQSMVQRVATGAALTLAMLRAGQERSRGYREMSGRVSHMCAADLVGAQYRLRELRESLSDQGQILLLDKCMHDIEEAQRGFDRARLLGSKDPSETESIQLAGFLSTLVSDLCGTVRSKIAIEPPRIPDCTVQGSRTRLTYALRDLILTVWLIGRKPRKPVDIRGSRNGEFVNLLVEGDLPSFLAAKPEEQWSNWLRDPSVFLVAPDRSRAPERILGVQLAWVLIEQFEGGQLSARRSERGMEMLVQLPATFPNHGGAR
jgi:hypothetical protein